eukprot:gene17661-36224_t
MKPTLQLYRNAVSGHCHRVELFLSLLGLPFESIDIDLVQKQHKSPEFLAMNPLGQIPVLVDGDLVVWDTLAIAEYLAETHPGKKLWPQDARARARARSICAEMHSGFTALRSHCPMNIEAQLADTGALIWRDQAGVRADVQRLVEMWSALLQEHGGPLLFGDFTVADAYLFTVSNWARLVGVDIAGLTHLGSYRARVGARPAVVAAMHAEGLRQGLLLDGATLVGRSVQRKAEDSSVGRSAPQIIA